MISEKTVTWELAKEHGLSKDEYDLAVKELGRVPTFTELGLISVMWSEHCSYKSSKVHLKTLPTTGPRVIHGPGENAGVVDIGDGQCIVFKMESHNHPSFIEPYQGAATGVGGICRDVFTMGARPIALANNLRFGRPDHPRTAFLVSGVVSGIGGYGNSFGVPMLSGDINFDESYDGNILVNAFCLGLARADRIFLGTAKGVGNPVIYVGARTGRDGIHGATMASQEFSADAEEKRPAVQVGDPFMEKLLLEACLELMSKDVLVGIQDMGAAGLTSSSVEMAARAGSGIDLDLSKVPMRETGMTPYELCLSESQERMLMVVKKGSEQEALDVFKKWDLEAAVIGTVTESGRVVMRMGADVYADVPAGLLTRGVEYERPRSRPTYLDRVQELDQKDIPDSKDGENVESQLLSLLAAPNIASKAWVYHQYDVSVRHGTVIKPGQAGAGMVRVFADDGREKGVAIATGCMSRWVYLDPYQGARAVVAECYANLIAVGAEPLAVTDCLNFGNPEKPDIMWQFAEAVRGLGDACRDLETPIVSGNVSLYNETHGNAIKPTPMIGMVGLIEDVKHHQKSGFQQVGDTVCVVGSLPGGLGGSEYLERIHGLVKGLPPAFDKAAHMPVFRAIRELGRTQILSSCDDVSDGGILCAIAECAVKSGLGADLSLPRLASRLDELLFGEGLARFVITYPEKNGPNVVGHLRDMGVPFTVLGQVGGSELGVKSPNRRQAVRLPIAVLKDAWQGGFVRAIGLEAQTSR
jgi:phosphoribosylformylglycinamidine synthase